VDWAGYLEAALRRHDERAGSAAAPGERDDLRLGGVASASWSAGLAALMLGQPDRARGVFRSAADEYVASWDAAPAGSWGRPIAALKCRLLADDREGARREAERTLAEGALPAETDPQRYAGTLALLVLGRDSEAAEAAAGFGSEFPGDVAAALSALGGGDAAAYEPAVRSVLASFEARDAFLEEARVADTVLALQALAAERGLAVELSSPLLPG
jgi:hypothetical protein